MLYSTLFLIGAFLGLLLITRYIIKELKKELADMKKLFSITFDLLWMEVRDKNDLTFNDTLALLKSMQETPDYLPKVKETLALRIVGENKKQKVGF